VNDESSTSVFIMGGELVTPKSQTVPFCGPTCDSSSTMRVASASADTNDIKMIIVKIAMGRFIAPPIFDEHALRQLGVMHISGLNKMGR
jgi:hypothetical protein